MYAVYLFSCLVDDLGEVPSFDLLLEDPHLDVGLEVVAGGGVLGHADGHGAREVAGADEARAERHVG